MAVLGAALAVVASFAPVATVAAASANQADGPSSRAAGAPAVAADSLLQPVAPVAPQAFAVAQVGIKDQSFGGAGTAPSGSKPESKAWFNDGIWWASMWDSITLQFHIFRLVGGTTWQDTGTVLDTRASSRADALWDGSHLYIASHDVASDSSHNTANRPARLYRFSYNSGTKVYTKDSGFPVTITTVAVETLVIDKDSTGTIWATWTQAKKLTIAHTVGNDLTWSVPFTPALTGTSLNSDDISSVIAFGGNRIGVMWSNQSSSHMYFTTHLDGDPDTTWSASEAATTGSGSADDHINLKTDSSGRIYAAVKTSFTASSAVLIHLLVRGSGGGWSDSKFGTVGESHTRPIVLIDEQAGVVHMFATGPYPGNSSGQSGGSIYEKTAPIGAISFTSGSGTAVIQDPSSNDLNNTSSTKQNVNGASGIVVIATNDSTKFYWHAVESLGSVSPPVANFTGTPLTGGPGLNAAFTDTSTGSPTSWSWDFGDPTSGAANTSILRNPSHVYNNVGTFTVKLTASNGGGPNTLTRTNYVTVVAPPTANFSGTPLTGSSPLTVSFTDSSTGNPTSWSWDFGDPTSGSANTSTLRNPSHVYNSDGTFTVKLTASNAGGPNTLTQTNYVTVSSPPTANFTGTPLTGGSPLTVAFTDTSTGSPTTWSWDFGDPTSLDNTSALQNPSHSYGTDGTYTVALTVSNANGPDTKTRIGYVTVGVKPVAAFSGTPLTGPSPQNVQFTDASSGTPTSWNWDFGDPNSGSANTSSDPSPIHTYSTNGSYTVKLTVTNASGSDSLTRTAYVKIGTPPVASFTATPTSGSTPLIVNFSDTSTGGPTAWSWDFGDPGSGGLNASIAQNPSHTYTTSGTYTVKLTATNVTDSSTATQTGLITVTAGSPTTLTLNPIADAHVSSSNVTANYGGLSTLKVREGDGSTTNPNYRAYLKFDVSGVSGTVSAVTLRLFVTDASANLESVYVVGDSSWTETGITYANAPAITGSAVGTTQGAPLGGYVSITLVPSSVTPGTSPLTLALRSSATDSFIVSSREDATNPPQLVVTFQ